MRLDLSSDVQLRGEQRTHRTAWKSLMLIIPILALLAAGIVGCNEKATGAKEKNKDAHLGRVLETNGDSHRNDEKPHEEAAPDHGKDEDQDGKHAEHEHEGETHEKHGRIVKLSPEEIEEFGIKLSKAGPGKIHPTLSLTGEVILNPDKVVHVMPRVPGVVRDVFKSVGDEVKKGDLLAILDSAELAKAKSEFLEAVTREDLVKTNFEREKKLWKEQVTPEKEFLAAQQLMREATIRRQRSERALHALGLSEQDLMRLPKEKHKDLTRYDMRAPLDGVVIKRHIVRGEVIKGENHEPPFVLADLSSVWINFAVYQKDLGTVRKGQELQISSGKGVPEVSAKIDYVSPVMDESTRTSKARVVLQNSRGLWQPGMFVTGHVRVGEQSAGIVVPKTAVLKLDGAEVIFVKTDKGCEPREVQLGQADRKHVEILKGLNAGDVYVAEKGFTLKAELNKSSFAGEGHAH